jgi:hypothetical protein
MNKYRLTASSARWRWLIMALAAIFAVLIHAAAPVRDRVLDEVQIIRHNGERIIEVNFSFPLRYQSHFPATNGDELRIRLRPLRVPLSDLSAVSQREALVPENARAVALDEVTYEGDVEGGPYLTLTFTRPVHYEVIPGSDFRSVNIVVVINK